jgi:hypothetical protein
MLIGFRDRQIAFCENMAFSISMQTGVSTFFESRLSENYLHHSMNHPSISILKRSTVRFGGNNEVSTQCYTMIQIECILKFEVSRNKK